MEHQSDGDTNDSWRAKKRDWQNWKSVEKTRLYGSQHFKDRLEY